MTSRFAWFRGMTTAIATAALATFIASAACAASSDVPPAGDDFYGHVNGAWLRDALIAPDASSVGAPEQTSRNAVENTRRVVEAAANDATNISRVAVLYRSFTDEATVNALGDFPLRPMLARIRQLGDKTALARFLGERFASFGDSPLQLTIAADAHDPLHYTVYVGQAGLGLPNRDYYLDARYADQRRAYESYVAAMLALGNWPNPARAASRILALETAIARVSWTPSELRDPGATYNPIDVGGLDTVVPGMDWQALLGGAGLAVTKVVVTSPSSVKGIAALVAATPMATWRDWLAFHGITSAAPYLSQPFVETAARFNEMHLAGAGAISPRWRTGIYAVGRVLRDDIGKLYVDHFLPPSSQRMVEDMAEGIRGAFAQRINKAEWMSASTKTEALNKLMRMDIQVGRPAHWVSYDGYDVRAGDLFGNMERGIAFRWKQKRDRLGTVVDHSDWYVPTQVSGAYYEASMNMMVVDAGILQAPNFDPAADAAVNYGAIGAIIGHEMSHGFDDTGRKSDEEGRLRDWWSPEDASRFEQAADNLAAQYSGLEPSPGIHVDGKLSLGEALADLGGLLAASDAYLAYAQAHGLDGHAGLPRLFDSFAAMWREKQTESALRTQLLANPHPPASARVNMTVRNVDAWYTAFDIPPNGVLYLPPDKRARVW